MNEKRFPFISRLLFLLVPIGLAIVSKYGSHANHFISPKENTEKPAYLDLEETVEIRWSPAGVPIIHSNIDGDRYFILGYIHAQMRSWQLSVQQLLNQGRLSEYFGASFLESDKLTRTLEIRKNAQGAYDKMQEEDQFLLKRYCDGINAGFKSQEDLPIQFTLYDVPVQNWTPLDTLMLMQRMSWDLSSNLDKEYQRLSLLKVFGYRRASELVNMSRIRLTDRTEKTEWPVPTNIKSFIDPIGKDAIGSNSWVVSGEMSKSGAPMLAVDPHMVHQLPSRWFLARYQLDSTRFIEGVTIPGMPMILMGRNETIAWGVTNMMADTQDLVILRTDSDFLEEEPYQLSVKGNPGEGSYTKTFYRRRAAVGPVLTDHLASPGSTALALKWGGPLEDGGTFRSLRLVNRAQNWSQFIEALDEYVTPPQNFVYADISGNIGFSAAGKIPYRKKAIGDVPEFQETISEIWSEFIPFKDLPREYNPREGYIVSANNDMNKRSADYTISVDWPPSYRKERIEELIRSKAKHDFDSFKEIQSDSKIPACEPAVKYLELHRADEQVAKMLNYLTQWDCHSHLKSREATIFSLWMHHLNKALLEDDISEVREHPDYSEVVDQLLRVPTDRLLVKIFSGQASQFCDFRKTTEIESCAELVSISISNTFKHIDDYFGSAEKVGTWGEINQAVFYEFPLSFDSARKNIKDKLLSNLFSKTTSVASNQNTINIGPAELYNSTFFVQKYGATYRQINDLASNAGLYSISTGQSGNVFSKSYGDRISLHSKFEYVSFDFDIKRTTIFQPASQPERSR